jgi:23S rRNA (uracil1939-C5)-methyltransferase
VTARGQRLVGAEAEVLIERLGHRGDGIARLEGATLYVPDALPGDRLRVRIERPKGEGFAAQRLETLDAAPRRAPPCRHFAACGGCQLQHLPESAYLDWQRNQVLEALARQGIRDVPVRPVIAGRAATRRRARLAFTPARGRLLLGFRARAQQRIVDLEECPIALPAITQLLPALRAALTGLPLAARGGEVLITATDTGLDLLLQTPLAPGLEDRETLAGFATDRDLARLAWRAAATAPIEPLAARRPVRITLAPAGDGAGPLAVDLPPGAFLQATADAEQAIRAAISEAIGDGRRVADLFAGIGTFGLPLARAGRTVLALEADAAMVDAQRAAAASAGLERRLEARTADLERQPLQESALRSFDALILDPPRAGARAQCEALATASVARLAMVSCNPRTFARDARCLLDQGRYRLLWVQPIDAFLWSHQIELVAAFQAIDEKREHPLDSR